MAMRERVTRIAMLPHRIHGCERRERCHRQHPAGVSTQLRRPRRRRLWCPHVHYLLLLAALYLRGGPGATDDSSPPGIAHAFSSPTPGATPKGGRDGLRSKGGREERAATALVSEPCNVVLTHTNADFDSLAAAVALSMLWTRSERPGLPTHVVLPRGTNPVVQRFLAFHKHLLPLRGFKTIVPEDVRAIGVVDAQGAGRIGRGRTWLDHAESIHVYDHHDGAGVGSGADDDLLGRAAGIHVAAVGSTTTLLVEKLRDAGIAPAPHEATLLALGIRADTGGLVYDSTTLRDAAALLWCMESGASQVAISEFGVARMGSEAQRRVLQEALRGAETEVVRGLRVSSVLVEAQRGYIAGLAQVCEEVMDLTDSDVFLLGATHRSNSGKRGGGGTRWISLIGRASAGAVGVDLNYIMSLFQGGGHPKAAAAALRCSSNSTASADMDDAAGGAARKDEDFIKLRVTEDGMQSLEMSPRAALDVVRSLVRGQIPEQLVASSFMDPEFVSVREDSTVGEAHELFAREGLKSAPIVDAGGRYRSSLKLSDIVKALRAGRSAQRVKGMVRTQGVKTVLPDTDLAELERLLVHEGVGRIPVVDDGGVLLGIVTRTDVLRQRNYYDPVRLSDALPLVAGGEE